MPSILPGSKKLGSERTSVSPQALNGHGIFIDAYRSKMLLHRYLESAAIKHDLTLNDACLLLALENPIPFTTKKELDQLCTAPTPYSFFVALSSFNAWFHSASSNTAFFSLLA